MNRKEEKANYETAIIGACIKSPELLKYVHHAIDKDKLFGENQSIYEKLIDVALYQNIDVAELWLKLKGVDTIINHT